MQGEWWERGLYNTLARPATAIAFAISIFVLNVYICYIFFLVIILIYWFYWLSFLFCQFFQISFCFIYLHVIRFLSHIVLLIYTVFWPLLFLAFNTHFYVHLQPSVTLALTLFTDLPLWELLATFPHPCFLSQCRPDPFPILLHNSYKCLWFHRSVTSMW